MKANKRSRRAAQQLFRLCHVDGHLDDARLREVASHLAASRRRGALAALSALLRMVRLDRDRHTALVESAAGLPSEVRDEVTADLTRRYGSDLETTFSENPALIGGMRVRVGSDVYDGSVRARLAAIERGM
jgi:F-type H+-transporting ATPase subunit delta